VAHGTRRLKLKCRKSRFVHGSRLITNCRSRFVIQRDAVPAGTVSKIRKNGLPVQINFALCAMLACITSAVAVRQQVSVNYKHS